MSVRLQDQDRPPLREAIRCTGINSTVTAADTELVIRSALSQRRERVVPISEISSIHAEAKSVFPPVTIVLISTICLALMWGYGSQWSWPIMLPKSYDVFWSWSCLFAVLGLFGIAYRLLFASLRIESKGAEEIVVRLTTKKNATRFVQKLRALLR